MTKPDIGIGLIGSGFMGRTHALGFLNAGRVFDLPAPPRLEMLADVTEDAAQRAAAALGFRRATGDWRTLVADPDVQAVAITTPNALHREMALAAIAAGKHVHCEKPLAATAADARSMAEAAARAGVVTAVGFNYLRNPMLALARDIIEAGEIGEIRTFTGIHAEDYMADPEAPWTWRLDPDAAGGALADIGSHIIATARFLLGPIERVLGDVVTVIPSRPAAPASSQRRAVTVDDVARAHLRFASGASGSLEASWVASGRKMRHDFEIAGSRGAIAFSQERLNELLLYRSDDPPARRGFRTIFAGPAHPPYGAFCIAPGHQIGFNDLKTIEMRDFLLAIAGGAGGHADFAEGLAVMETTEAIVASARQGCWVRVGA